jgi:hypothetical protein
MVTEHDQMKKSQTTGFIGKGTDFIRPSPELTEEAFQRVRGMNQRAQVRMVQKLVDFLRGQKIPRPYNPPCTLVESDSLVSIHWSTVNWCEKVSTYLGLKMNHPLFFSYSCHDLTFLCLFWCNDNLPQFCEKLKTLTKLHD